MKQILFLYFFFTFYYFSKENIVYNTNPGECAKFGNTFLKIISNKNYYNDYGINAQNCNEKNSEKSCCYIGLKYKNNWHYFCGEIDLDDYKNTKNFIRDFYQNTLSDYKPPATSSITSPTTLQTTLPKTSPTISSTPQPKTPSTTSSTTQPKTPSTTSSTTPQTTQIRTPSSTRRVEEKEITELTEKEKERIYQALNELNDKNELKIDCYSTILIDNIWLILLIFMF